MKRPRVIKRASVICVGDEILEGRVVNSNAAEIGRRLTTFGYSIRVHLTCGDRLPDIRNALETCSGNSDLIIVNGGLGPTPDDLTRHAVAKSLGCPLESDAATLMSIRERLARFNLPMDPSNAHQAMFPKGASILPNPNGTAPGFEMAWGNCRLMALPGPPRECLPMLDSLLAAAPPLAKPDEFRWRLLGVIEADVAAATQRLAAKWGHAIELSYLWRYPYVDVRLAIVDASVKECAEDLDRVLAAHTVSRHDESAMALLLPKLESRPWHIDDRITDRAFEARLPARTDSPKSEPIHVKASADRSLTSPWEGTLNMMCDVRIGEFHQSFMLSVPHRGPEVTDYACEFLAWSMVRALEGGAAPN